MSGLRDYSVVYFGNDWFAENRTSSHHIARRLGKIVPVLYIETPGSRSPQSSVRDVRKLWRKLARALAPPQKVGERFYVATIPQIPFRKLPLIDGLNRGWAPISRGAPCASSVSDGAFRGSWCRIRSAGETVGRKPDGLLLHRRLRVLPRHGPGGDPGVGR